MTPEELRLVTKAAKRLFHCCVDMGFQAANTVGNARETAAWARLHGFRSLIVVTADYHMPRSLLELRAALPGVRLTPYPVRTGEVEANDWQHDSGNARRLLVEYCKYLAILARETVLGLGPRREPGDDDMPAPVSAAAAGAKREGEGAAP